MGGDDCCSLCQLRADFPVRHTVLLTGPINTSLALRAADLDTHMWPSCSITKQGTQAGAHLDTISCFQLCCLCFFFFKVTYIAGMQSCVARQKYPPPPNIKGSEPGTSSLSCSMTISVWNSPTRLSKVWKISQIKGCSVETLLLICPEISCA